MKKLTFTFFLFLFSFSISIVAQEKTNIKSLLLNGNYQKVINILETKLNKQDSLSFNEYNSLGIAYQNLMNYQKALPMFHKAIKFHQKDIRTLMLIANANVFLGRSNIAKSYYKIILEIDSTNLNAMISLGKTLIDLQEFTAASELYKKMILTDSTNSYFYSQLGICELRKGNKNLAITYFEESLRLNDRNTKTILRLAKLYYNKKQFDKAKEIIQKGLSNNSRNKSLNKMLAEIYYKKRQYEDAIIKYLYAITIGDSSAQTYQKLGMSYYYLSFTKNINKKEMKIMKLKEGISALEKSYQKENDNAVTALYLGLCHKTLNEHKEAIKYFEESLDKMFPDYIGEVYKNLAVSDEQIKNYKDAITNYREAIKFLPGQKSLLFYLASVYDRYYKDKSIALSYYKKFINNSKNADPKLIDYTKDRIKKLNRDINFWGK